MKLTSIALSNIKHNMKNYTMYFFAMCFCVFTTYSFANLAFSETVFNQIMDSQKYQTMFIGFGIAILVFVLFFLISSNNSFIRYRKKEISTYSLFGMENKRIGQLLFFETIIIGLAALVIGIGLGVFFSKLMGMILLKMMLSEYAHVNFSLSIKAFFITTIAYFAIFFVMGLSGLRTINKFQLVDLFKGDRVSEKRTTGSYILLIISVVLIALGYSMAISDDTYKVAANMLTVIGLAVIGSYLFYIGGLQKLLYLIKRNKKYLYKKSRLISISLLSHKAQTFATTMGTISLMIATSVTAMAFGYTLYQSAESNARELNSFDVWYYAEDEELEGKIYQLIDDHNSKATNSIKFQRYVSYPIAENLPKKHIWLTQVDSRAMTYSESVFNEIVNASQDSNPLIEVKNGVALVLYPNYYTDFEYDGNATLTLGETIFAVEFLRVSNPYAYAGEITVVFSDSDFNALLKSDLVTTEDGELWPFVGINYKSALSSKELAEDIAILLRESDSVGSFRIMYDTYIESMKYFGLICFIGYFVCAVFVLMSVSLLYFKQIAIGAEEIGQYEKLRKIGMDKEQEAEVIRNRITPVFFVPLIMGLIHSVFAMKGADTLIFSNMMYTDGPTFMQVLKTSSAIYIIYSIIYLAFYFITKYKYTRVVGQK